MLKIAICGATGYTGEELIRLLLNHPKVELTALTASAKMERPVELGQLFPRFAKRATAGLRCESLQPDRLQCDAAFLALPAGVSKEVAPTLLKRGIRVIDLSPDYRLKDAALYPQWYDFSHPHPKLLAQAVYGLPERYRSQLGKAMLVANPGCYATSMILGALPAVEAGLVDGPIVVDAKSGLTGAGRKAETALLFAEIVENVRAYKVNAHRHMPEAAQELTAAAARPMSVVFVPQVVPIKRGMLSNVFIRLTRAMTREAVLELYQRRYAQEPFVRVRANGLPEVRDVTETNYCDLGVTVADDGRLAIVTAVLDNLTKGAAGQAAQNLNLMYGWPETTGLL